MTVRSLWRELGRLPSLWVFVGTYAVVIPVGLVTHGGVRDAALVLAWIVLAAYCVARPDRRSEVYGMFVLPGLAGVLLAEFTDGSSRWGGVLVPVTLLALHRVDRDSRRAQPVS